MLVAVSKWRKEWDTYTEEIDAGQGDIASCTATLGWRGRVVFRCCYKGPEITKLWVSACERYEMGSRR